MGLKNEAVSLFSGLFGPEIASQLNSFDDPGRYSKDFLEECTDFMAKLIGKEAAEKKMAPLVKKYSKK